MCLWAPPLIPWELYVSLEGDKAALLAKLAWEIGDPRVIEAMWAVPREAFVPRKVRHLAYRDESLPIGEGQTISQPYMVAWMTSALELQPSDKVLEVGTGSGYQAAILAQLARVVITLERFPALACSARTVLRELGLANVEVREAGDVLGCPEEAPFDAIIVSAGAPPWIPQTLLDQMALGCRMVIPVGSRRAQQLMKVLRTLEGHSAGSLGPCRFVPLIGRGGWKDEA